MRLDRWLKEIIKRKKNEDTDDTYKFYLSITHLKALSFEILEAYKALKVCDEKGVLEDELVRYNLFRSIGSFVTIKICAFLDEYNKQLVPGKYAELNETLRSFKLMSQPAVDAINRWKDLKEYRNHVLAHNYRKTTRTENGKRIEMSVLGDLDTYDAPKTIAELHFISECINIIDARLDGFNDLMKDFTLRGGGYKNYLPPRITKENVDQEIKALRDKSDRELVKLRKRHNLM